MRDDRGVVVFEWVEDLETVAPLFLEEKQRFATEADPDGEVWFVGYWFIGTCTGRTRVMNTMYYNTCEEAVEAVLRWRESEAVDLRLDGQQSTLLERTEGT